MNKFSLNLLQKGHKGQLAPCCRALGTMIKIKSYHGSRRLSTCLGSTTLNTSSLGLGEPKFKDAFIDAIWLG